MNVEEAIKSRRSIRKFQSLDIPREALERILQAGIDAPSGKNRQPWRFVVVRGESKKEMVEILKKGAAAEEDQEWAKWAMNSIRIMDEAPVSILVFNPYGDRPWNPPSVEERFQELVDVQSVGAAIENMALTATDLGIGSLWICDVFIAYEEVCKWSGQDNQLVAALTLGYPAETPTVKYRKNMDEVVVWRN